MPSKFNPKQRPSALDSFLVLVLIPIVVFALSSPGFAQEKQVPKQPAAKGSLPALATKVAFPNLKFDRPVAFAAPDDGSNLVFVNEQHTATIWSFPNDRTTSDKKLFLALPDPINKGNEEGLLGLAFHPTAGSVDLHVIFVRPFYCLKGQLDLVLQVYEGKILFIVFVVDRYFALTAAEEDARYGLFTATNCIFLLFHLSEKLEG